MLKKIYITLLCSFFVSLSFAQSDSKNVLQSDISGVYRNAVKKSYYKELGRAHCLSQDYYGQFDFGTTLGLGDYAFTKFEVNSTHGYQFNPYFYLGGGVGAHFMLNYTDDLYMRRRQVANVLLYVDTRVTFIESTITPYVEARAGYFVTYYGGAYANIAVGCRFATYYKQAINVSLGYSYERLGFDCYANNDKFNTNNLSIKIGYEF